MATTRYLRLGHETFAVVQATHHRELGDVSWEDGILLVDTFNDNAVIWLNKETYDLKKERGETS